MPINATEYMTEYLEGKYPYEYLTILENCCQSCLRGSAVKHDLTKLSVRDLFKSGAIDPDLAINSIHTGSAYHSTYIKTTIIDPRISREKHKCSHPGNCNLTCVVCRGLIVNGDNVSVDRWPGFSVHKACVTRCLYPCCQNYLPTLPAYMCLQRPALMCETHKSSDMLRKAPPAARVEKRKPIPGPIVPAERPISLPQPPTEPKIVPPDPPAKKTFQFKRPPQKAKADKFQEGGRSKDLRVFFGGLNPVKKSNPTSDPKAGGKRLVKITGGGTMEIDLEGIPGRRYLKCKSNEEIFGYREGGKAYHILTGEELFQGDPSARAGVKPLKLDFSAPPDRH